MVPSSLPIALALIVVLLMAVTIVLKRRRSSARPAASSVRPPQGDTATSESPPSTLPIDAEPPPPEEPKEPRSTPFAYVILPESIDGQSVADAVLASAVHAGSPISCSIWRADGASDAPIRVIVAGSTAPDLASDDIISAAIEQDSPLLRTLTMESCSSVSPVWRHAIPVSFGDVRGVAVIDFVEARPNTQVLRDIVSIFRLPLAAALTLHVARQASDSAHFLLHSARELTRGTEPHVIASTALDSALPLAGASTGSVMLYDDSGAHLRIVAARGLPARIIDTTAVGPGDGIAGWVALSGQSLVVEDLPDRPTPARSRGVRSGASVPIADEDGVLGVLNVGCCDFPSRLTSTHLESLETLARQTAVALRGARVVSSVEELYLDSLKALALALETKDPYAMGGMDRIMRYVSMLSDAMGLSHDEARTLDIAAMLHDIGMSAVGETLMVSDRPLSTVERGLLSMHPIISAEILDQAPALRDVVPIVYHHHERYDGTGYVAGLTRDEIPLGARILAVADSFVAMTSDRPYRPAMTQHDAIKEIRDGAGSHFDPVVVEAFAAVLEEPRHNRMQTRGA